MNKKRQQVIVGLLMLMSYILFFIPQEYILNITKLLPNNHFSASAVSFHSEEVLSLLKEDDKTTSTQIKINTSLDLVAEDANKPKNIVMQCRLDTLNKACNKFKHVMESFKWSRLLYIGDKLKLAYCALEKVASRTWGYRMAKLNMSVQTGTKRGDFTSERIDIAESKVSQLNYVIRQYYS